jgi:2-oxoglutarate ferredoxin oxidoreductase subunit beta
MTKQPNDYNTERQPTWCPGCGNFGIWAALKNVMAQKAWEKHDYAIVYGIGCSGNMPDFVAGYGLHSLHGRSIPNAEGIKLANHDLPVICIVGDGDTYGEAGNHLIHSARGNHDITVIVHDNRIYGLTTGQASPTSRHEFVSKSTPHGVIEYPVNGLALAISQGATFVAQGFAGDLSHLTDLIAKAVDHKGFSLVNVFQPCVTWNKIDTFEYYRSNTYKLEEGYDPSDKKKALEKAMEREKLPLGIVFTENRPVYHEQEVCLKDGVLVHRADRSSVVSEIFSDFR